MEVQIRCLNNNCITGGIYFICIYNCKNELVYSGKTNMSGILDVCLQCGVYRIIACSNEKRICTTALISCKTNNIVLICFNSIRNIKRQVSFTLTDKYYKNLPISKGVINLWQQTT